MPFRHCSALHAPGLIAALVLSTILLTARPALAEAPVRLGLLSCEVEGSGGRLLTSRRELSCTFERVGGRIETYAGEIRRYGLDLGRTRYSDIGWAVFSLASRDPRPGALEGSYGGLSAGISLGVGIGANALVGGLERSFVLQPLSLETSRGVNLALGVARLELIAVDALR